MNHIAIISSSVRDGRNTQRVALFFEQFILERKLATVEILDLKAYNFPVFEERLKYQKSPDEETLEFAEKIKNADGIIIATPEYNGGYPASLKNVIDLLYEEWHRKPIGLVTVSTGASGGAQVMTSLLFTLWKMHAWVVPAMFQVAKVESAYQEDGTPVNKEASEKHASKFLNELKWCMEAKSKMQVTL